MQSGEYAVHTGQDSVVCRAGIKLGRKDSSFCLFKVSGKQKQVGQRAGNPHGHQAFPPPVGRCHSEHLVQLLPCFAACERALSGPKLQVVCSVGLFELWGCWLSLCCFLLYCGNLLSGCCVVSLFPFLCVRAQGSFY